MGTGHCNRRIYWRDNSKPSFIFYLQNTGSTGSIAIKLKPAALTQLFGFSMDEYLDKIVDLDSLPNPELIKLKGKKDDCVRLGYNREEQFVKRILDEYFAKLTETAPENPLEGVN
jgi:hypothetical protein